MTDTGRLLFNPNTYDPDNSIPRHGANSPR